MLRAPYEIGEKDVLSFVIESLQDLNDFFDKAHATVDARPTVVLLETKGYSKHWVKGRKEIDGENYQKNVKRSGITINAQHHGPRRRGYGCLEVVMGNVVEP